MPDLESGSTVLIDSDAFVAAHLEHDANHLRAKMFINTIRQHRLKPLVTSLVIGETATVLSHKVGVQAVRSFFDMVKDFNPLLITQEIHDEAITLFYQQTKRGTSYVDLTNIVVMQQLKLPAIFAFDKVYSEFSLTQVPD